MFNKWLKGRALYTEKDRIWIAKGMSFWAIDERGNKLTKKYRVGNFVQRVLSAFRLSRQLFREGLHHLLPFPNGDIFVTAKKKSYLVDKDGKVKNIFAGYRGNKPAHQGICMTPSGTLFFGEYTLNSQRDHDTKLYRSTDGGITFNCVLTLKKEEVRHIHFVKYDPYEDCVWLGTGDRDEECKLMKSVDNGETWRKIGEGSQNWRAIGVCFTKTHLIWGTDAGSVPDQNRIIRMDRKTCKLEILADVEGPCHGCASFADGRVFISTGIEGGVNEKDRFARLKEVSNTEIKDVCLMQKDIFPLIVQYGVMRFPLGTENTDKVFFTAMGLKKGSEVVYGKKETDGI